MSNWESTCVPLMLRLKTRDPTLEKYVSAKCSRSAWLEPGENPGIVRRAFRLRRRIGLRERQALDVAALAPALASRASPLRCTLVGSPAIEDVCLLCVGRLAGCSGRAGCCVLGCRLAAPGRHSMSPQAMRSPLLAGPLTPARGVSIIVCLAGEQTNTGSWVARAAAAAHYPSGCQIQRSKLLPPRRATSTRARYKVLPDL